VAVSEEKIQELNNTYGGKNKVTDILSFGEYSDREDLEQDTHQEIFLGEIFFCYQYIVAGAREDEVTATHEMMYVFSHGVLHLLGYDHEEEMFAIQDDVTEYLMQSQEK
jgi:probable rRNA maturation factor